MKEETYKPFIITVLIFIGIGVILLATLPIKGNKPVITLALDYLTITLVSLSFIVYKGDYIYYYPGIEYKDVCQIDKSKRDAYTFRHFIHFLVGGVIYMVYSIISLLIDIYYMIDPIVFFILLVVTIASTVKIKLAK